MEHWGMPGIGGSLGTCAVCGEGFLTEILLNQTVSQVVVDGFDRQLSIHTEKCKPKLKAVMDAGGDWQLLPDGPLRQAFSRAAEKLKEPTHA